MRPGVRRAGQRSSCAWRARPRRSSKAASTTDVHQVQGDQSGPHKCDGTNGGANTTPGATATGALDDGSDAFNFSWAGSWTDSFEDFIVNQIGPDAATSEKFWGVAVNGKSLQVGGCQYKVEAGDEVLCAYDVFSKKLLQLRGPATTRVGRRVLGQGDRRRDRQPGRGRERRRQGDEQQGRGPAALRRRGVRRLKARADGALRSNQLRVRGPRRR